MVERDARRLGAFGEASGREAARFAGVRRGWRGPCVLAALALLVLGAWCLPARAGSGTTGVLGISNIKHGAGGGEEAHPARRGVAIQGPVRHSP